MTRTEQFRERLDILLDEFSGLPYEIIADELEYYQEACQRKCNLDN